jgi:hypothetical protein
MPEEMRECFGACPALATVPYSGTDEPDYELYGARFSVARAIATMNGHGGKRPGAGRPKGCPKPAGYTLARA